VPTIYLSLSFYSIQVSNKFLCLAVPVLRGHILSIFNMLGYSLPAGMKMFSQGIRGHSMYGNKRNNGPSCGIGDSLKNVSSCFHFKYFANYVVA
jgi:hypothetical protein